MALVRRPLMQESTGDILKKQRATHREKLLHFVTREKKFYFVPKKFYHNSKLYIFTIFLYFLKL